MVRRLILNITATVGRRQKMSLLAELEDLLGRWFYKYVAPNGASTGALWPVTLMLSLKLLAINHVKDASRFVKDSVKP